MRTLSHGPSHIQTLHFQPCISGHLSYADTQSWSQPHTHTTFSTSYKWTRLLSGHSVMFPHCQSWPHINTTFLTSHKWAPLLSGHSVMVPATYTHHIFNLLQVDTSPKWTFSHGPSHTLTLLF